MTSSNLQGFCKDPFWAPDQYWWTERPKLTQCLAQVGFTIVPNIIFWLLLPIEFLRIARKRNKRISLNLYNLVRFLVCALGVLLNAFQLVAEFISIVIVNGSGKDYRLSDFLGTISKLLSFVILFILFIYHRRNGIITSGVVWTFLLFNSFSSLVLVVDIYFYNEANYFETQKYVNIFNFLCNALLFIVCSFTDDAYEAGVRRKAIEVDELDEKKQEDRLDKDTLEDANAEYRQSPEMYIAFPNRILFSWFSKVVWFGRHGGLTTKNLWNLEDDIKIDSILSDFRVTYDAEIDQWKKENEARAKKDKKEFSALRMLKVFVKQYGGFFLVGTIAKLTFDIFQFLNPQLLQLLITFIRDKTQAQWHGVVIVLAILFVGVMKSLLINLYFERMMKIGMKLKSNIINQVYMKSLRLSSIAKKERTTGEIVNLISVDANRFLDVLTFLNLVWSAPFQIIVGIWFLYQQLGYSALAGVACIIAIIPINAFLINCQKKIQMKQMKFKDERIKLMNEVLSGIRILKLYSWEPKFMDNVSAVRKTETGFIKRSYYVSLASTFFFTATTILVSVASFGVYIFSSRDNILTPEKAFVSISLFSIIQFPINMIPNLINFFILAHVALKRINRFMNAEELIKYVSNDFDAENAVSVSGKAMFTWDLEKEGDDEAENGKSGKNGKENDKKKDKKKDKNEKKNGVISNGKIENGKESNGLSNGINGKEKKDIFHLKDIEFSVKKGSFTCVIGQVGSGKSSLLSALLGEMQLREDKMKSKCKVNISEDLVLSYGAQLAWIQNDTLRGNILFGEEFESKRYSEVIRACALEPDLEVLPGNDLCEIGEKGINLSGGQKQRINLARVCYSGIQLDRSRQLVLLDDPLSAVDAHVGKHLIENVLSSKTGLLKDTTRILVTNQLHVLKSGNVDQILLMKDGKIEAICSYDEMLEMEKRGELEKFGIALKTLESSSDEEDEKVKKEEKPTEKAEEPLFTDRKLIDSEKLETAEVSLKDYWVYIQNAGLITTLICVICYISEHSLIMSSNLFLSTWTNRDFNVTEGNITDELKDQIYEFNKKELGYFTLISAGQCLANIAGNFFLIIAAISTSIKFHKQLLRGIMRSPMSFFDTTPIGRIINKFAKDIDVIDMIIPQTSRTFVYCCFRVVAAFVIIVYILPKMIGLLIVVLIVYYFVQKLYVTTSRQLKRLDAITRSPIFSHFSETITGASTIRAYGATGRFEKQSNSKINLNNKCYWLSIIGYRWLGLRLDFLGNVVIFLTAGLAVFERENLTSGDVGLVVSYAMSITQLLTWTVRMVSELETNVVSVERINEYSNNQHEDEWEKDVKPPSNWPSNGVVEFEDYSTRYREGTPLVLKNLSVKFDSLEKVGVVGRTGAGKSSMTLALFRIVEADEGRIVIDNLDISQIGLHDLRGRLSIIPQDPILFSGTIRFNLDPFSKYTDTEVWKSLESAHLKDFVNSLQEGLQYQIAENGENLSIGQRQLICLARALLKKSKILVLDEATASVDYQTDVLIQETIRREFKDCTTITIAHRINTILDSSKILVLDKGERKEYGAPQQLLADTNSMFYSLARSANEI